MYFRKEHFPCRSMPGAYRAHAVSGVIRQVPVKAGNLLCCYTREVTQHLLAEYLEYARLAAQFALDLGKH